MTEIIGVRFKNAGKVYYFSPSGLDIKEGDRVIVETARGVECGEVVLSKREISEDQLAAPLKPVMRIATEKDFKVIENNKTKEQEAFEICEKKIQEHGLKMNLIDVECTFDNNSFCFISLLKTEWISESL